MPAETKAFFVEPDGCFLMSVTAAIDLIESELTRCYENKHQTPYASPFKSSPLSDPQTYSNGYITIRPYYWGSDDDMARLPNLECEELQVSWYKHSHRGSTSSWSEATPTDTANTNVWARFSTKPWNPSGKISATARLTEG